MMRKKCEKTAHKFQKTYVTAMPYVFCSRWWCDATAVSVFAPSSVAVALHNAIPKENRFPPVELNNDGSIKELL